MFGVVDMRHDDVIVIHAFSESVPSDLVIHAFAVIS